MLSFVAALLLAAAPKTAVLDLQAAGGVEPDLARAAGLVLPSEVRKHAAGTVISGEEIRSMIGLERQKQLLGCGEDSSCLAEISGALGVDELVSGNLGRVGKKLVLELHRVDTHAARTLTSATRTVDSADDLIDAARSAVGELYEAHATENVSAVAASSPRSSLGLPLTVGGATLAVAGAVGCVWALSIKSQVDAQQNPSVTPTVSTGTARTAQTIFPIAVVAAAVGTGMAAVGIYSLSQSKEPASDTEVSFIPMNGGGMVSLGGRF